MQCKMPINSCKDSSFCLLCFTCPGRTTMLDARGEKAKRTRDHQNRTTEARNATKTRM